MKSSYARAYTEVLEIISHFSEEEYKKIPKEKIEFYEKNKDKEYKFKIDSNVDISNQKISQEANAIIILLYREYFATEKQKKILKEILQLNQEKAEIEKKKRYNSNNIFNKK